MEEWLTFEGQTFSFTTIISRGHGQAEQLCQQNNSHLAEITSTEQEEFIDSVIDTRNISQNTNCLWIGLQNSTGEWMWPSGKKLEYDNWEPGEPNLLKTQRCVNKHIAGTYKIRKTWFNEYCDSGGQSCGRICQKPVDTSAVIQSTDTIGNVPTVTSAVTSASSLTNMNRAQGGNFPVAAVAVPVVLLLLILALVVFHLYRKRSGSKPKSDVVLKSEAVSGPNRARTENANGAWHDLGEVEGVESWDNDHDSFANSGPELDEDETPNVSAGDPPADIEV